MRKEGILGFSWEEEVMGEEGFPVKRMWIQIQMSPETGRDLGKSFLCVSFTLFIRTVKLLPLSRKVVMRLQ